jgi:hypothetical protein
LCDEELEQFHSCPANRAYQQGLSPILEADQANVRPSQAAHPQRKPGEWEQIKHLTDENVMLRVCPGNLGDNGKFA